MLNLKNTPERSYITPTILLIVFGLLLASGLLCSDKTINNDIYFSITTGILTSIVASFVFLLFLFFFKPNLKISKYIAHREEDDSYYIKVINKSYFFSCHDVQVKLFTLKEIPKIKEGISKYVIEPLEINKSNISFINNQKEKDDSYSFTLDFRLYGPIKSLLNNNSSFLMFRISGKHSFSGFSKIYTRYYRSTDELKEGIFLEGDTFDTKI